MSKCKQGVSERFAIYKTDCQIPWFLEYPDGFDPDMVGEHADTFAEAVRAFVIRQDEQCPTCLCGAVEDRPWGWECTACGSSDVAVGCTR